MRELEERIINSVFGEDQYRKVSFLESEDFTNYPGYPYREYFRLIKQTKANKLTLMECIIQCKNKELRGLLSDQSNVLGYTYPENYGLKLLEIRFQTLFANLLVQLSNSTTNTVERDLLNKAIVSLPDVDIFDLSDHLLEYLGLQASGLTKGRINSFLEYRNKRIKNAKQVINELR